MYFQLLRATAETEILLPDPIITLTTDFGLSDHLVGTMKGVILNINPAAHIVDINHNVAPFDILDGALTIANAYRYFPPRTIHVVIVDPGVGTERRPLLVSGEKQYFIAPDNGVLSTIFERESCTVRHITAEHYFLNPVSPTFHGRDVFAPTAAWLSKAWQTEAFGEEITDYVRFSMPKPKAGRPGSQRRRLARGCLRQFDDESHDGRCSPQSAHLGRHQAGREWQGDQKNGADIW